MPKLSGLYKRVKLDFAKGNDQSLRFALNVQVSIHLSNCTARRMEKIHLGCVKHNISMKRENIVGMRERECNDAMPWAALSSPYPLLYPSLFSSIFPISHQPDRLNWMLCWMRSPSPISSLPFSFPNLSPISFVSASLPLLI